MLAIFIKGNKTIGNSATTGIGKESVTHSVIMSAATANTFAWMAVNEKGLKKKKKENADSAMAMPKNCLVTLFI